MHSSLPVHNTSEPGTGNQTLSSEISVKEHLSILSIHSSPPSLQGEGILIQLSWIDVQEGTGDSHCILLVHPSQRGHWEAIASLDINMIFSKRGQHDAHQSFTLLQSIPVLILLVSSVSTVSSGVPGTTPVM